MALWLVAATGLGAARAVLGSPPWALGSPTPEIAATTRLGERRAREPHRRSRPPTERKQKGRRTRPPERAAIPTRQRLALSVGHSLPVPVDKAPRYRLDNRHHDYPALDLSLRYGTPVRAVTAGRVRKVTKRGACGRGVIVRGRDGLTYTYCHGNRVLVRKGEKVPVGEKIMKSGNTGNSSGPHLHLQVASRRGRLLCPQHMLGTWQRGKKLPTWKVGRRRCVR